MYKCSGSCINRKRENCLIYQGIRVIQVEKEKSKLSEKHLHYLPVLYPSINAFKYDSLIMIFNHLKKKLSF